MQIVIDIPDDVYIDVLEVNGSYGFDFIRAIKDGMILPKGHGRLIDADETLKRHCNEMCKYKMY